MASVGPASRLSGHQLSKTSFNVVELPEMIFVETRFITEQAALQNQLDNVQFVQGVSLLPGAATTNQAMPNNAAIQISMPAPAATPPSFNESSNSPVVLGTIPTLPTFSNANKNSAVITMQSSATTSCNMPAKRSSPAVTRADVSTETEAPNPQRDREQQTDAVAATASLGIQCNLSEELELQDFINGCDKQSEETCTTENIKQQFLKFVQQNSWQHAKDTYECLKCGEIKSSAINMQRHMVMHQSPRALCCLCGETFSHESLLQQHSCAATHKASKKVPASKLRCPHFRCRVRAISQLELFDHINEHCADNVYSCLGCKSHFATAGELRHHMTLRLKCLEKAKRQHLPYDSRLLSKRRDLAYRVRVFELHSEKRRKVLVKSYLSRLHRDNRKCQICLQKLSNSFKFARHSRRCMKNFRYRLTKSRLRASKRFLNSF